MNRKILLTISIFIFIILNPVLSQTLEIPVITNVTVDKTTQQALLSWTMNTPGNVDGYIIKRQIFGQSGVVDGSYNTIETINDPNQFSYLDVSLAYGPSLPGSSIETYRIASFKDMGGGNIVLSNMSGPVSTVYLSPVGFDLCLEQNNLSWTSYKGFGANLTGYNVYYLNTLNGTPVLIGELSATDTTFIHTRVTSNTQYYYYIEALSNVSGLIASSNIQSVTTTMPPLPQVINADYATVEFHEQVNLSFSLDQNAEVDAYLLLKSDSINGSYDTIASYASGTASISYSDFVKTNQEVAYYKVLTINTCGLPSRESNVAGNIVLEAYPDATTPYTNQLNWNAYESWLGGVENYAIYRSIDNGAFEEIAQLGPSTLSYTDDITEWVRPEINGQASKGHFCYYVGATEGPANPYEVVGSSKSNISCAHQETVTHLPNAINPNSQTEENRTFKPVISFVNDYQLIVYDRWGEIVFQSTDPLLGWNGRDKNGNLLKKGTYVFYLKYRSRSNKLLEKSGQINLVY